MEETKTPARNSVSIPVFIGFYEKVNDVVCIPVTELRDGDEVLGMKIENMVWTLVVKTQGEGGRGW